MPFTPDSALDLLFPEEFIPQHIKDELPPEHHIRPLASTDYERGHLSVLAVLKEAPDVGAEVWEAQFQAMRNEPGTYYILVVVSRMTDQIVGSGGVFYRAQIYSRACISKISSLPVRCSARNLVRII